MLLSFQDAPRFSSPLGPPRIALAFLALLFFLAFLVFLAFLATLMRLAKLIPHAFSLP